MPGGATTGRHCSLLATPRTDKLPPLAPPPPSSPSSGRPHRPEQFRRLHHADPPDAREQVQLGGSAQCEPVQLVTLPKHQEFRSKPGLPRHPRLLPLTAAELAPWNRPETPLARVGANSPLPQDLVDATIALIDIVRRGQPDSYVFSKGASLQKPSRGKKPPKLLRGATFVNSIAKAAAELDLAERRCAESKKAREAAKQKAEQRRRETAASLRVQVACRVHAARLELLRLRAEETVRSCMTSLGMSLGEEQKKEEVLEARSETDSPVFVLAGCGSGVSSKSSSPLPMPTVAGWSPVLKAPSAILSEVGCAGSPCFAAAWQSEEEWGAAAAADAAIGPEESFLDTILYFAQMPGDSMVNSCDQSRSCSICEAPVVEVESPAPRTPEHLQGAEVATVSVSPTSEIGHARWEVAGQPLLESLFAEVAPSSVFAEDDVANAIIGSVHLSCSGRETVDEDDNIAAEDFKEDSSENEPVPLVVAMCEELAGLAISPDIRSIECMSPMEEPVVAAMRDELSGVAMSPDVRSVQCLSPMEEPFVVAMRDELPGAAISPDVRSVQCLSPMEEPASVSEKPAPVLAGEAQPASVAEPRGEENNWITSSPVEVAQAADAEVCAVLGLATAAAPISYRTATGCESCGGAPVFPLEQVLGCRRVLPGRAISSCASSEPMEAMQSEVVPWTQRILDLQQSFKAYYCAHVLPAASLTYSWKAVHAPFASRRGLQKSIEDFRPTFEFMPAPFVLGNSDFEEISPKRTPKELRHLRDETKSPDQQVLEVLESLMFDEAYAVDAVHELTGVTSFPAETTQFFGDPNAEGFEAILQKRQPGELAHVDDEPGDADDEVLSLLQTTLDEVELLEAGFSKCPAPQRDYGDLSVCDMSRLESVDAIDGALRDFVLDLSRMQGDLDAAVQARVDDAVHSAASELAKDESFAAVFHGIQSFANASMEESDIGNAAMLDPSCDSIAPQHAALQGSELSRSEGCHQSLRAADVQPPSAVVEPPRRVWTPVHSLAYDSSSAMVSTALQRLTHSIKTGNAAEAPEVCSLVQRAYVEACSVRKVKPNSRIMATLTASTQEAAKSQDPRPMRNYNFANAHLGDRGLIPVLLALAHDPGAACVNLSSCGLHMVSVEVLADFLKLHPTLHDLDLGGNTALSSMEAGLLLLEALEESRAKKGYAPSLCLAGTGLIQLDSTACRGKVINPHWPALRPNALLRHQSARQGKKADLQRRLADAFVRFE